MSFTTYEFKDTRGSYMKNIKKANIERIREWLKSNPNGTKVQCAKDLNLNYRTVVMLSKEL